MGEDGFFVGFIGLDIAEASERFWDAIGRPIECFDDFGGFGIEYGEAHLFVFGGVGHSHYGKRIANEFGCAYAETFIEYFEFVVGWFLGGVVYLNDVVSAIEEE